MEIAPSAEACQLGSLAQNRRGQRRGKVLQRSMLAQGTYQADSASERFKLGQNGPVLEGSDRATIVLILGQVKQCRDGQGG